MSSEALPSLRSSRALFFSSRTIRSFVAVALSVSLISCGRAPKTFDAVQVAERSDVRVLLSPMTAVPVLAAADRAIMWDRWLAGIRWRDAILFANAFAGAAAREAPSARPSGARAAVSASGLGACGGALPPCYVKARESGGSYLAVNPSGCGGESCGGAWQFAVSTWNDYGGYHYAQDAPPAVQDAKARELYAGGAGCSHWGC